MAYNGSGTFLINTAGQPVVSGTVISSTAFNALTADLATGLSTAITKDGQTTVTANIPMSTYKFTGLGVGSAATDSANLSQVQSTVTKLLNSVSGADTITATASPTLAAYAAGQMFYFVAAGDNTTSVTLNIDSLGAKAVTRDGATALAASDIKSGEVVVVVYDGTRFQVVSQLNSAGDARFANVSIASSLYVGGVSTFVGNAGFSANVSIASALSVGGVAAITGATTIGGNLTLSGGTANGVLYLNGSKVATSGSALVFDGTNFASTGIITSTNTNGLRAQYPVSASYYAQLDSRDGNTYLSAIGNTAAIVFRATDGAGTTAEGMRLTTTGLGIGTASPGAKLNVVGSGANVTALITDSAGPYLSFLDTGNAEYAIGIPDNSGAIAFVSGRNNSGNAGTERMRLDSSGNLGIGTASPAARLHVAGASQLVRLQRDDAYIQFANTANTDTAYIQQTASVFNIISQVNGAMIFGTNSTERARITSGGDLLVGTSTAVNARLQVDSGSAGLYGYFNSTNANGGYAAFASSGTVHGDIGTAAQIVSGGSTTNFGINARDSRNLIFGTNNAERARITSGGEFYVNTTAAGGKFYVVSDLTANNGLRVDVPASFTASAIALVSATAAGTGWNFLTGESSGGSSRIQIRGDGNVYNANGTYGTISDARLKQDIVDAGSQWDDLKAIRFRKYRMKADVQSNPDSPAMLGVVAQELEAVCPGLVDENTNKNGEITKTVKSSILLMKAAVALQEAMARIEKLEAEMAALKGA